jgi:hypothetical protein
MPDIPDERGAIVNISLMKDWRFLRRFQLAVAFRIVDIPTRVEGKRTLDRTASFFESLPRERSWYGEDCEGFD